LKLFGRPESHQILCAKHDYNIMKRSDPFCFEDPILRLCRRVVGGMALGTLFHQLIVDGVVHLLVIISTSSSFFLNTST